MRSPAVEPLLSECVIHAVQGRNRGLCYKAKSKEKWFGLVIGYGSGGLVTTEGLGMCQLIVSDRVLRMTDPQCSSSVTDRKPIQDSGERVYW